MIELVEGKRQALAELCRQFEVERLYVFGSAAQGRFRAGQSDLDFVVQLANREATGDCARRYLDLAEALEQLFQRSVDLVSEPAIRNPYFRREVEATRQLVYEGPHEEGEAVPRR